MRAVFLSALLLFPSFSWAGSFSSAAKGTTTAGFLELGAGARAVAMGEAYSAVVDETSAMYWNPAAMTRVEKRSVTFMHAAYIDSSYFDYLAYVHNLGSRGALGLGVQYLSAGKITERDKTGTDVGSFTPNDLAVSVGYAHEFLDGFSVGLAAKFIRSTIIQSAQTAAADFGVLSPAYLDGKLRLAFTVSNLGGKMKFEQESESLPLAIRLGSAYKIGDRWIAGLDVGLPKDNSPFVALGTEYVMSVGDAWNLAGRLGINSRTMGDIDGFTGFSFGLGLARQGYSFDYGFLPLGGLGQTHRISLSFKF